MEETQVRLTEKLSKVCKDYCNMTWDRALIVAGVLADFVWRLPESVYYHPEIREVSASTSSPPVPVLESFKQLLAITDALPLPEIPKGSS